MNKKNIEPAEDLDSPIQEIKEGGKTRAILYRKTIRANGVKFLTPTSYPLQIGLIEHSEGKNVPLHIHRDMRYDVNTTQEVLYIEKGTVDITLADENWEVFKKFTLTAGDFVLFVSGAHGVDIKKGARVIEIKQGPYPGDDYAKRYQN